MAKKSGVRHIVFLSVQGGDKTTLIHHKIEALIRAGKIPYTFLMPTYFMQNFTTTLLPDLVNKRTIFLSAGEAKFTLIDIDEIGALAAKILMNIRQHVNKAYDFTCEERLSFMV